ncbi:hypothetical protein [Rhodococcus marinonascens]|uniref:hypothetical protein n=1 Tax=Rhodococcus marinonascens TaxID=38311 RepID=UPI000932E300|nr:hypothetical protein [Rhodococcus marinonascens]
MTGASAGSAALAARLGLPYSFAHFIHETNHPDVAERYRQEFTPGPLNTSPCLSLCIRVVCADSADDVAALQGLTHWLHDPHATANAIGGILPSWTQLQQYVPPAHSTPPGLPILVGTPTQLVDKIDDVVAAHRPDEVIVTTACPDFGLRARTYELIADMLAEISTLEPARSAPEAEACT